MSLKNIFICYRRDDAEGYPRLLRDRLNARFPGRIFMDVTNIAPGSDFTAVIQDRVGRCHALIAIIGRSWLTTDSSGLRRIDQPEDYVRREIASALSKNQIAVIPVLVRKAEMPTRELLPPDIVSLSTRNAIEITEEDFDHDVQRLIQALEFHFGETYVPPPPPPQNTSRRTCLILAIVGILVAGGGLLLIILIAAFGAASEDSGYVPTSTPVYSNKPTSEPSEDSSATSESFDPVGSWQLRLEGNGEVQNFNVDIHSDHTYQYGPGKWGRWSYSGGLLTFAATEGAFSISVDARSGNTYVGHSNIGGFEVRAFLTPR